MKRINYILSFFIAFTLIACSPEEKDLFDDSSANRIEASLAQVNWGFITWKVFLKYGSFIF